MDKKIIKVFLIMCILFFSNCRASETNFEIRGLFSGTDRNKLEIIDRIIKSGKKIYLPELAEVVDARKEKNDEVRSRASLALLTIGDSTCVPYYKKALVGDSPDPYWQVRLYAVQGLVKYGEGAIVPDFKQAMKDSYWQVRYYASMGLAKYGDERDIPFLISSIRDANPEVKGKVLWALFSMMWKENSRFAFRNLKDNQVKSVLDAAESSDPQIRIRALWLLDSAGDARAVPVFIKLLEDKEDEIKIRALWAIERLKSGDGNKEIESLLLDESTQVKIESIRTLVRLKASENITGLVNGLSDSDERVRIYSLWALEKFREPLSYPYIVEKLADDSPQIREYAEKLIESIDDTVLWPVLQSFADNSSVPADARITALSLLGNKGGESVTDFFMEKTKDRDSQFRYAAINALFKSSKFDVEFLKTLVYMENHDDSARVRRQSTAILREIMREFQVKLESSDAKERQFALDRIESLYGTRNLTGLLLRMVYSKYPEVREKMLVMAREIPSRTYGKSLSKLIREPDMDIKKLSAFAIGESKYREAIPLLKEGTRHFDPEYQLICAWALARMNISDAFPFGVRYLQSSNVEYQKLAAEIFVFLSDKRASYILLRSMLDSELEVKLLSAWALARMGEDKGLETLVRLSEESVEPVRTRANVYLEDKAIPAVLRRRIPSLRESLQLEKLGILEIKPKTLTAASVKAPVEIDGSDSDRFWKTSVKENLFVLLNDDKVPSAIQTKVAAGYDKSNLYFLVICEDPNAEALTLNSRDFITIALHPFKSDNKWFQFVIHPLGDIKYSYVWTLHSDQDPEKSWISDWKTATKIEKTRWIVEISMSLESLSVEKVFPGDKWSVNFQRDSQQVPLTTWTGRIDSPEQFGVINFRE